MEYHPGRDFLILRDYNPDKAKSVEIGNVSVFLQWSREQPSMILHELSHGYLDQYLANMYAECKTIYHKALRSGRYDLVPRNNGRKERAYAMTNEQEYFAESTEAFFGINDFYPFNRKELVEFDPDMYRFLQKAWGI